MSASKIITPDTVSPQECQPTDLIELLRWRASSQPNFVAYSFLEEGDARQTHLTYKELDEKARALAVLLQALEASGERVLLVYPSGLEYLAAFFGCIYAGAIPVPAYPPRSNRNFDRLHSIIADARPSVALTTSSAYSRMKPLINESKEMKPLSWTTTDKMSAEFADRWRRPSINRDSLAFLQYTSGSISSPKGVMISHDNVLHNQRAIQRAFDQTGESIIVGWLPLYHDMGLIGNILQSMYVGARCILMSPLTFLQRPFRWLEAISKYKATTSGGPNFSYDLCVRRIDPQQLASLDLSSWKTAFNGAEPIRPETLERFAAAFEPCGFRREAFRPCYGLAEATLFVSGKVNSGAVRIKPVQAAALANDSVEEPGDGDGKTMVSCGAVASDQRVAIVNPKTLIECSPKEIGEVWLKSRSVAQGYWNLAKETDDTFGALLADSGDGPFLRTGDLGFIHEGELFITGRMKDLIIIRGLNYYPQDIEFTVQQCDPSLRGDCGAAFSMNVEDQERLVVVQEVERHSTANLGHLIEKIRQSVAERHELVLHSVALIKSGSIPKTSSAKIQRNACRAAFLAGRLDTIARWQEISAEADSQVFDELDPPSTVEDLHARLSSLFAAKLGIEPGSINISVPVTRFNLDSLAAIELAHEIESSLTVSLPMAILLEGITIAELAAQISDQLFDSGSDAIAPPEQAPIEYPLSYGQRALWYLRQVAAESSAYNIAQAICIHGKLHAEALQRAFRILIYRHPLLRATFITRAGEVAQQIREHNEFSFRYEDASGWADWALDEQLLKESRQPFDLEQGDLLRVRLYSRSSHEHVLLLVIHHIVADMWSLAVLLEELGQAYEAERTGPGAIFQPLTLQYSDYVRWQQEMLGARAGERLRSYWLDALAGNLPVMNLPTDRPRPPIKTYAGASHSFRVKASLNQKLNALAQASDATPYMVLLGAFQVLLYRYCGQRQILVGSPTAGRARAGFRPIFGYFTNPIVLRGDFHPELSFEDFLRELRSTALGAFEHQDYPFALLVEQLQPMRDQSSTPLFQVLFSYQKTPLMNDAALAPFAVGEPGARIRWAGLELESMTLKQQSAQFDLTLMLAESDGELAASLQYNTDLFDHSTIARMAENCLVLLEAISAKPQRRVSDLSLLAEAELSQLLRERNQTRTEVQLNQTIHRLIEEQVERIPDASALVFEDSDVTYAEVNRRANQLARFLGRLGVGPEMAVGIYTHRSVDMVIGLLATLKAGGAYLPLDRAYPKERLAFMLEDAQVANILTHEAMVKELPPSGVRTVRLDEDWERVCLESDHNLDADWSETTLAYVIYTSGSTGRPKGVMIGHANVANFFKGMDQAGVGDEPGTWLAVTSISFDISVLEILWPLTRGFRVVIQGEEVGTVPESSLNLDAAKRRMDFSLFYFASDDRGSSGNNYRLLIEGAQFADQNDFTAIWTPERHLHAFGGLYPNPSVTSAALAMVTKRIRLRAGSVVLPLHNPVRVAEEWSVVDNLSNGRVGLSFASGWHANDFIFAPQNYPDRKEILRRDLETVRRLWRGETISLRGGAGGNVEVTIHPRPIQSELPMWITAAGSTDTFRMAGQIGANLLTHLLGQSVEELSENIAVYREAWIEHGHGPQAGCVTLMLHTFIERDFETVRDKVREPFCNYLMASLDLARNLLKSLRQDEELSHLGPDDLRAMLEHAFDRYFDRSGLFGTPETCLQMINRLKGVGVDEVACLIDFGVDFEATLSGLHHLNQLRLMSAQATAARNVDYSLPAQIELYDVSHLQCTPSMATLLLMEPKSRNALRSIRKLLIGGEAFPPQLASQLAKVTSAEIRNMYGPTETTIWSATHLVGRASDIVTLGRPIANTQLYVFDERLNPVPHGVSGELLIGGSGLARGYLRQPELTADKFIPDPFAQGAGRRVYRTSDLVRFRSNGELEFLGRTDDQVKIRGHRIESGEIETVLAQHPAVREVVVVAQDYGPDDRRLVAYYVPSQKPAPHARNLVPINQHALFVDRQPYRLPNGLQVAHRSGLQTSIIYREIFEDEVYAKHGISINDGDCIFDVGANIGLFTLYVNQWHRNLTVFAFEPIPPTFDLLRANVLLYGLEVNLYQCGLSDKSGESDFTFYPNAAGLSGRISSVQQDKEATRSIILSWLQKVAPDNGADVLSRAELDEILEEQLQSETYSCQLRTLSEIISEREIAQIDLLKVDVEGGEIDVLSGIREEDWPKVKQIVLEVHSKQNLDRITELLERHGYTFRTEETLSGADADGAIGARVFMFYAMHPSKAPSIAEYEEASIPDQTFPTLAFGAASASELRGYLKERLPEYMIPWAFVEMSTLPLTPNGKINRRALPMPTSSNGGHDDVPDAPQAPLEIKLAQMWADMLKVGRVGIRDDFFEAGGHSLTATQFVSRVRAQFNVDLTLRDFLRSPTIEGMAEIIRQRDREDTAVAHDSKSGPIGRRPNPDSAPMSYAQLGQWFLYQLEAATPAYNFPAAVRLAGALDVDALRRSLNEIVRRHEALRTTFALIAGEPQQIIARDLKLDWPVVDLRAFAEEEREAEARRIAAEDTLQPFNLTTGPVFRIKLLRLENQQYILLVTMHHIVVDGWTLAIFIREMAELYNAFSAGKASPLPEMPIQYADYAYWQRQTLQGEALENLLAYWKKQLGQNHFPLELPADHARPSAPSYRGNSCSRIASKSLTDSIRMLSQNEGVTVFMTLLAAYNVLLHRHTNCKDIFIGTPVANRDRAELEGVIGNFVNMLPLRSDLSGNPTFRELLRRVREVALEAYSHQELPFEKVVESIQLERDASRPPLFQVTFVFQNVPIAQYTQTSELRITPFDLNIISPQYDLTLSVWDGPQELTLEFIYKTDMFERATINRMLRHYETLLSNIVAQPDATLNTIEMFTEGEKTQQIVESKAREETKFKKLIQTKPKAISFSQKNFIRTEYLQAGGTLPLVIRPAVDDLNLAAWSRNNLNFLEAELGKHGAILFRGFHVSSVFKFEQFARIISPDLFDYRERSSPRTEVGNQIYTSTDHPPDQWIQMHSEHTYSHQWPLKIWFCCLHPAQQGGETPIANNREILKLLGPNITDVFKQKRLMYVRNYGDGLGVSWQTAFQTDDRSRVEEYCRNAQIEVEWKPGNRLRTRQIREAIVTHPRTGDLSWFNHANIYNIARLDPALRESLVSMLDEQDLPFNTYYGDGSAIESNVLDKVREAYNRTMVSFPWHKGDVLMLDNLLTAHGRKPYTGQRQVIVAMGSIFSIRQANRY
jgi:natural product biosynthesis luciferase-like monooxygenase protein/FkbM family methyltransferase